MEHIPIKLFQETGLIPVVDKKSLYITSRKKDNFIVGQISASADIRDLEEREVHHIY